MQFPEVADALLLASQDLTVCPAWDDFVDLLEARRRLLVLSRVCKAWATRARRLVDAVWVVEIDADPEAERLEAIRTVVWAYRGPGIEPAEVYTALTRCPNATDVWIHKPPLVSLPATIQRLYSTGFSLDLADTVLKAPQLTALSMLQLNPPPLQGADFNQTWLAITIASIGCGAALRSLTLHLFEHDDGRQAGSSFPPTCTLMRTLTGLAPGLQRLAFVDEWDRSEYGTPSTSAAA